MATPPSGLRISRVPGKPVIREADGGLSIPLWLQRDGRFDTDLALRLTAGEAEMLHAQLCFALDGEPVTTPRAQTPDCRKTALGPTGEWRP
ncbi:hypothetical protein [Streptomyces sp. NPDC126499]|uniref:hypothetical protein n=1 Tax=Streptomyces sp. NPDC126499 TaxID=3155314 RepID=UPI00331CB125